MLGMAVRWQFNGIYKMKKGEQSTYPYKPARLVDNDNDLAKRWFVVYYAWSEKKEKLVRKRMEITGEMVAVRLKEAKKEIGRINTLLKAGAVVDEIEQPISLLPVLAKEVMPTMASAVEYFLKVKKHTMKEKAHGTYRSSLKLFQEWLSTQTLTYLKINQFTVQQANAYMDYILLAKHLSNKSHNKHKGVVITLFNFFIKRKTVKENPFEEISSLSERPGQHTAFNTAQVQKVRDYCELIQDEQLWLFLNFIYYTFARPGSELRLLKVGDVLDKTVRLDVENAKNNRTSHVTIPPPLDVLIEKHKIRSHPLDYFVFGNEGKPGPKATYEKYFYSRHRKVLDMLKLQNKDFDLYGWKHTGVIALYQATKDVKLIQRRCRHSSLDQTDKYLRDSGLFLSEDEFNGWAAI